MIMKKIVSSMSFDRKRLKITAKDNIKSMKE